MWAGGENKEDLPVYSRYDQNATRQRRRRFGRRFIRSLALLCTALIIYNAFATTGRVSIDAASNVLSVERLTADYATCAKLRKTPSDPSGPRDRNARFVDGQVPILFRNASVWIGEPASGVSPGEAHQGKGYEWLTADVLVDNGLIKAVESSVSLGTLPDNTQIFELNGLRLTAGIVDMHSHAGVDTLPTLEGWSDDNELSDDITPYVRSIDGLNPLDPQIQVIKSGGVTTSLILPGSGNNIGGEAFVIKHAVGKANHRPELSNADLLADPERNHRYMKMACGENAKSVYGRVGRNFGPFSRLGEAFYFRHAFEQAASLKTAQDDWCAAADKVGAENMQSYLPADLKWESLSAVLRGQVMVNTHCYTIPDLETFIGFTNEFKFPVRAFHHAHQTYLVPEVLKRVYGGRPPAAALFADNMYYKAESYVASEQAGKLLWESGITPVYVSDNPVLNAQHVLLEAAKAYHNGLPYHVAFAGVTSASAELLGLGERIGKVKPGFDADLVIWDDDPLAYGATPLQVFIDGTPQFDHPSKLNKTTNQASQIAWKPREVQAVAVGVPDLVLTGVTHIMVPGHQQIFDKSHSTTVVIKNGQIICVGDCATDNQHAATTLELINGTIAPPLTAFGSTLGLEEIAAEDDTSDGANDPSSFSKAIDGLALEGKNNRAAHAHGVTRAISAPKYNGGGFKGVSAGFLLGASHALEHGAVFNEAIALHYPLDSGVKQGSTPTISSAIASLKSKLLHAINITPNATHSDETTYLHLAATGAIPLVINVHSADTIASLLRLKSDIDQHLTSSTTSPRKLNLIIHGGAEAHLVGEYLASAHVPVILAPLFAFRVSWDQRRALVGAPLDAAGTGIDALKRAGVRVAIGVDESWEARDLWTQIGIVFANGGGKWTAEEAVELASGELEGILGLEKKEVGVVGRSEFVVFEGNPLDVRSQVRAVADGRGKVSVWLEEERP